MIDDSEWHKAHEWETEWHGNCLLTYLEEEKQFNYASCMGLTLSMAHGKAYFNLKGKSVLDIGGGPVSLLLKCVNKGYCVVVDPLPVPQWVLARYDAANIDYFQKQAEKVDHINRGLDYSFIFDEIWMYNLLQHTQSPRTIIENARKMGKIIRVFDWIDTPPHAGHPQTLRREKLDAWLGGEGKVKHLAGTNFTEAYYGVFPTPLYEKI